MAITTVGQPTEFTPGYNPIYYYFDSTNKNEPGFRYIISVYEKTGPSSEVLIKSLRIPPRIGDGYGVLNISKILQSYLTGQLPSATHGLDASDSYIRYNIHVGEEYSVPWEYSDYEFFSDPGSPWNGNTQLRNFDSPPVAHSFVAGDQIVVEQADGGVLKPSITGLQTVVEVPDAYTIVLGLPWVGSGITVGGEARFADNTKTVVEDLLIIDDETAFNGAISHELFRTYTTTQFNLNPVTFGQAVSTIPYTFTVRPGTDICLNWWNNLSSHNIYIYGQNDLGTIYRRTIASTAEMFVHPVGPGNISLTTLVSGSGPFIDDETEYYDIWIVDSTFRRVSEVYRFVFNRNCTKYEEFNCMFLDRLGSLGGFTFYLRNEEAMNVTRTDQKYILGNLSGSSWTYATTDYGSRTLNVDATTELTLRTEWLNDDESRYFAELVSSPIVYLDRGNGYFPAICQTNSITVEKQANTKNIRYTVNFRMANNEIINW